MKKKSTKKSDNKKSVKREKVLKLFISDLRVGMPLNLPKVNDDAPKVNTRVEAIGYDWAVLRDLKDNVYLIDSYGEISVTALKDKKDEEEEEE